MLEKAKAVRKERGDLMAPFKAGTLPLTDLLARKDTVVGKIRVRRVLESLPGIGANQRVRLLALFPPKD